MTMTLAPRKILVTLTALAIGALLLVACGADAGGPEANTQGTNSGPGGRSNNVNLPASAATGALNSGMAGANQASQIFSGTDNSSWRNFGISVSGRGEASAPPDLAVLSLGVESFAQSVAEARNAAATSMDAVIQGLISQGIAEEDIQTRHFSIFPRYSSREVTTCPDAPEPAPAPMPGAGQRPPEITIAPTPTPTPAGGAASTPGRAQPVKPEPGQECFTEYKRVILGYEVTNQITAKVRNLNSLGVIIDQATEAGGDLIRFQGVNFTIENPEALQAEARAAAIADLTRKANQVASLTEVALGNLIYFTETSGPKPQFLALPERAAFDAASGAPPTPILAGELDVVVTVQAVFDIVYTQP